MITAATKQEIAEAEGYQGYAKNLVHSYAESHLDKSDETPEFYAYVVWFCYILGGWKALVSTNLTDGMYYEVTYNRINRETCLDVYKKFDNVAIKDPSTTLEVHESHAMKYVDDVVHSCVVCLNCECHKPELLNAPCAGSAI